MRTAFLLPVIWIGALFPAKAQTPRLIALDGSAGESLPTVVERFYAPAVSVPASFLISDASAAAPLADIYLDGDKLGAPLTSGLTFKGEPSKENAALHEGSFSIPLPEISKPVLFRVVFRQAGSSDVIGNVLLHATPPELLKKSIETMTKRGMPNSPSLVVFGALPGLRELLTEWKVPFEDLGNNPPISLREGSVTIGRLENLAHLPAPSSKTSLFVICADPAQEANRIEKRFDSASLSLLKTPTPEDWRQSPLLQRLLVTQLQNHLRSP
jgi:hypothetical protein